MVSNVVVPAGVFSTMHRGVLEEHSNTVVTEGRTYIVGAALANQTRHSVFYIAIFANDVSPQSVWTAATFVSSAGEITSYSNPTRPTWSPGVVANGEVDSYNNKVSFTSAVDGLLVRGAALLSTSTKGGTGGVLIGATRFTNAKPLDEGEVLDVGYRFRLTAP